MPECSSPKLPSWGTWEREGGGKKDAGKEGMKGFFLPQIGTTRQMKITCLGGFDKIDEKIARDVFRAASGSYLLLPLSIQDSGFC